MEIKILFFIYFSKFPNIECTLIYKFKFKMLNTAFFMLLNSRSLLIMNRFLLQSIVSNLQLKQKRSSGQLLPRNIYHLCQISILMKPINCVLSSLLFELKSLFGATLLLNQNGTASDGLKSCFLIISIPSLMWLSIETKIIQLIFL